MFDVTCTTCGFIRSTHWSETGHLEPARCLLCAQVGWYLTDAAFPNITPRLEQNFEDRLEAALGGLADAHTHLGER
jgi:hypothetical protein